MFKKIDIFLNGSYLCSTVQSKNCKEAKESIKNRKYIFVASIPSKTIEVKKNDKITAFYSKN